MHEDERRAFEARCLRALARREYSRAELRAKGDDLPAEVVDAVLDVLADKGWQSDARFVEQYVRSKAEQGDGSRKIAQALRGKGIDSELLHQALDNIDWLEVAAAVYARKYSPTAISSPAERAKRQRFMAQRGFSFDEINAVMKQYG